MEQNTARNFVLQLGSLITLYVSLTAVLMIVFSVINVLYPDAASYAWDYTSTQSTMRAGIAMLIVFFPVFIIATRMVNKIRRTETGTYLMLTKWVVYLSLLVGGAILLGDLVTVIMGYLNGELTTRFLLKAAALAIVLGIAIYYFIQDARGFWLTHEKESKLYGLGVVALAVGALALGFMYGDSPSKVREMKLDAEQITNFQDMEWRIQDHHTVKKALPVTVAELYVGTEAPSAPERRASYTYKIKDEDSYELCANFAFPSMPSDLAVPAYSGGEMLKNPYNNWDHGQGETCFERTVYKVPATMPI
jgi:hypothetical protein